VAVMVLEPVVDPLNGSGALEGQQTSLSHAAPQSTRPPFPSRLASCVRVHKLHARQPSWTQYCGDIAQNQDDTLTRLRDSRFPW